jgi:hypothetical protein
MKYAEVKRYAEVYPLQREFMRRQTQYHDHVAAIPPRKLSTLSVAELQSRRDSLVVALLYLGEVEGIGRSLSDGYEHALGKK